MRRVVPSAAGLLAAVALGLPALAATGISADERVVFTITSPEITESSDLAVSTVNPKLVYTTNDSGDGANIYVLDSRSGDLVGTTSIAGVEPLDVEAIGTGTDGNLVVADIGDNDKDHSSATVYRIPQPSRGQHQADADQVSLTYSDGARDAESVLYDATTGRVYVVSKEFGGAQVYRTPPDVFKRSAAVLKPVAKAPALATDATFLPGEDVVVIRTYFGAVAYQFPSWKKITSFALPSQDQGESITAPKSGDEVWVGSEGERSKVLAVPLPDLEPKEPTPPASSAPPPATNSTQSDDREQLKDAARVVIVGGSAVLFLLLLVGAFLYRRHHPDDHEDDDTGDSSDTQRRSMT